MKAAVKSLMPPGLYRAVVKRRYRLRPSPLDPWRRLSPVSPDSNSRGKSVDRAYIEAFLERERQSVTGVVLEIGDDTYTKRFGVDVRRSDVLSDPRSGATSGIVGDLRKSDVLVPETYDCVIITQTLQFIDVPLVALNNLYTALKPGGKLLLTVPGIAQRDTYDDGLWGDFYRWMPRGLSHLLSESAFSEYTVAGIGNVLSSVAFLHNMSVDDISPEELAHQDDEYPLIVTAVAQR
jgi:SAM-dependent methyltransferase